MNTCQNCRFWLMGKRHRHEKLLDLGLCGKAPDFDLATRPVEGGGREVVPQYKDRKAFVRSNSGEHPRLLTSRDYGCPMWEAHILQETNHE